MIIFLTLLYVGVVALAIKIGIIKLNLFWKLSPLLWMLGLFVALFLPMQWGAPTGTANVYQYVIEIIPNVSGEVVEVPVEPLTPLKRGDVLFKIDPVPYKAKVDQLEAQLAATVQNVQQLEAASDAARATVKKTEEEIDIKKEEIEIATTQVVISEASRLQADANLSKSTSLVADLQVQVDAAKRELERQQKLLVENAGSQSAVDNAQVGYTSLLSKLHSSEADLQSAEQAVTAAIATVDGAKANTRSVELTLKQLVEAELPRAKAFATEAKLAAESTINGEHTSIANVRAQLASAQYDLEQTTVRAPAEGEVVAVTLRPGQRVANVPLRSWMAFVDKEKTEIVVLVQQYALRFVEKGQPAEVTFKLKPGVVFPATVARILYSSSSGQLQPSGQIVSTSTMTPGAEPYAVVLQMDEEVIDQNLIAGGAKGTAAIYTQAMQPTHIIRKLMIRMDAWMNYIRP
ncbi:MAG: biotin/lipoyl-binding protein [Rubripirellula sp.]|nr:biotin/lipoyl-binding protein [Rubripirellula sp.]